MDLCFRVKARDGGLSAEQMCNSISTSQAAIIALFRVINRYVGILQLMRGVLPRRQTLRWL